MNYQKFSRTALENARITGCRELHLHYAEKDNIKAKTGDLYCFNVQLKNTLNIFL